MVEKEVIKNVVKPQRLLSLDALRGFDMFWIISGEGIFHGFAQGVKAKHQLVQSTEDWQIATKEGLEWWESFLVFMSNQLHHSLWNGVTFYDLIFPLFIFIAGVSVPYSISGKLSGATLRSRSVIKKEIYFSLAKRTLLLIALGMLVNGALEFNGDEHTRFASVLARIGLSGFLATLIFMNFSWRGQLVFFGVILFGYWLLLSVVPVPGYGAGVWTADGNLAAYVDRLLLPGKLHRGTYDPEGLLSTIPAVATALLGIFCGSFLRKQDIASWMDQKTKVVVMLLVGAILCGIGWCWGFVFPLNKIMWTSSFVLYTGGICLVLMALFYFIIDVCKYHQWIKPLQWIGTNAILIYIAAHGLVSFLPTSDFLFGGIVARWGAAYSEGWIWVGVAAIQLWLLHFLYHKKIFLKL